jgi:hypothetical protein
MRVPETSSVDNALVHQKDELIGRINKAEYADELYNVLDEVKFLAPLWAALGYGYKTLELKERIKDRAGNLIEDNENFIAGERRPTRARGFSKSQVERLGALASTL